jgi:putative ABC transport system permease protein
LVVTGIVDDSKVLSHIKFDILIPLEFHFNLLRAGGKADDVDNWSSTGPWTYVSFDNEESKKIVEASIDAFVEKHFPISFRKGVSLELQPLTQIHTKSHFDSEIEPNVSDAYLSTFLLIVIVILLFSAINFVNLNTSVLMVRWKEFAVKGLLGGTRRDTFFELFLSSFRISFLALVLAIVVSMLLQPVFNELMDTHIPLFSITNDWLLLISLIVIMLLLAVGGTIQPLIAFSSRRYVDTWIDKTGIGNLIRKSAVGLQIVSSFILILATLIILKQVNFMNSYDLGFKKENVIILPYSETVKDHFQAFKNELTKIDGVSNVAWGAAVPGMGNVWNYRFVPEDTRVENVSFIPFLQIDHDFVETMGITMYDGREFDPSIPGDSANSYIVNQSFINQFGWENNYLGREIRMFKPGNTDIAQGYKGKVVGVFKDFSTESLHFPRKPLIMALKHAWSIPGSFIVRTTHTDQAVIDQIGNVWRTFDNVWPFEYRLLDIELSRLYSNEEKLFSLSVILSFLAIIISMFGLFGMNSVSIASQYKVISIKKVLGARSSEISLEVIKKELQFLILIFILGIPVGWYLITHWLNTFKNRVYLSLPDILLSMALISILIALTMLYHLLKMARTNPLLHIKRNE